MSRVVVAAAGQCIAIQLDDNVANCFSLFFLSLSPSPYLLCLPRTATSKERPGGGTELSDCFTADSVQTVTSNKIIDLGCRDWTWRCPECAYTPCPCSSPHPLVARETVLQDQLVGPRSTAGPASSSSHPLPPASQPSEPNPPSHVPCPSCPSHALSCALLRPDLGIRTEEHSRGRQSSSYSWRDKVCAHCT